MRVPAPFTSMVPPCRWRRWWAAQEDQAEDIQAFLESEGLIGAASQPGLRSLQQPLQGFREDQASDLGRDQGKPGWQGSPQASGQREVQK